MKQEYVWKHFIEGIPEFTLRTLRPLAKGDLVIDLCNGEKYRVLSVTADSVQTWPEGKANGELLDECRRKLGYTAEEGCMPRLDVAVFPFAEIKPATVS